jgi:putative sigma-54 modulation protein
MLITVTGKHIEITEALRAHAEEKAEKLPRYYNSVNHIEITIDGKDGGKTSIQVIAHAEHCEDLVVKELGEDTYACIDIAMHKLERQLRKRKEKQRNNKHIGGGPEVASETTEAGE